MRLDFIKLSNELTVLFHKYGKKRLLGVYFPNDFIYHRYAHPNIKVIRLRGGQMNIKGSQLRISFGGLKTLNINSN